MERDRLSFSQIMALLLGALMGPAAELLPGTAAGAGVAGALGVTGAVVLMAGAGLLAHSLARENGLASGLANAFGRWGGKAVLTIYIVWFELLLALRLHQSARRLSQCGAQDGAAWFFILVLAGFALWMARGRLGALGRAAQLFFGALCVAGGLVLVFSLAQIRPGRLLSDWSWSAEEVGRVLLPGWQVMGYGLFAPFLWEPSEKCSAKPWLCSVSLVWLVLVAMQMVIVGRFGPQLTMEWNNAFFQLAEGIGVKGAFQRVESLVAAIWVFSDLLLLGGLLWGMQKMVGELHPGAPVAGIAASATGLAVVGAMAVLGVKLSGSDLEGNLVPAGNLLLGVGVPGVAWLLKRVKKRRKQNG